MPLLRTLSLLGVLACMSISANAETKPAPTDFKTITLQSGVNDVQLVQPNQHIRRVLIELPAALKPGERLPVVFGFTGDGGRCESYNRDLSFYVRKNRLISACPQAESLPSSKGPEPRFNFIPENKTWPRANSDDLGFVLQIMQLLHQKNLADPLRIYATGGSAGGHMCQMLAIKTDIFAAIAPTKCGMIKGLREPHPPTPRIPIFWVMGDKDKSYYGGGSSEFVNLPVSERLTLWRQFNHCLGPAKFTKEADMTTATYLGPENMEVTFCILPGATHAIGRELARKTDAMIIEFFGRHSKK